MKFLTARKAGYIIMNAPKASVTRTAQKQASSDMPLATYSRPIRNTFLTSEDHSDICAFLSDCSIADPMSMRPMNTNSSEYILRTWTRSGLSSSMVGEYVNGISMYSAKTKVTTVIAAIAITVIFTE